MKKQTDKNCYKANASVIFTDAKGHKIDTFVIFDTDNATGLTHINHQNLKVSADQLQLHPKTVGDYHMPLQDGFSFEILKKLRDKYEVIDSLDHVSFAQLAEMHVLAKAS
jgi:hypothetical protein